MKKTYICPNVLAVKLSTTHSLLTVSGGDSGELNIINDDTKTEVWSRQDSAWDIWDDGGDFEE